MPVAAETPALGVEVDNQHESVHGASANGTSIANAPAEKHSNLNPNPAKGSVGTRMGLCCRCKDRAEACINLEIRFTSAEVS